MENDSALPDFLSLSIPTLYIFHEETVFEKQAATLAELVLFDLGKILARAHLL